MTNLRSREDVRVLELDEHLALELPVGIFVPLVRVLLLRPPRVGLNPGAAGLQLLGVDADLDVGKVGQADARDTGALHLPQPLVEVLAVVLDVFFLAF